MSTFDLLPLNVITNRPHQNQWLIEGHMEGESLGMLFGAPGSAKSFIAMDIAYCIAAGLDWNGNKTKQGEVIYLAGEGFSGIQKRFCALQMKYQTSTNDVYFSNEPAALMNQENVSTVHQKIVNISSEPALIIIDTLHRNFGDGDENSSKDFAQFLYNTTKLMNAVKCAVLFVHHSGHSSHDRARGSSSIKAALDVEYKISKKNSIVSMKCTKAKEFEGPSPSSFDLTPISIPTMLDINGNQIESAILLSTTYVEPITKDALTSNDQIVLNSLGDLLAAEETPAPQLVTDKHPEMIGRNCIHKDVWKKNVHQLLTKGGTSKQESRQKAFQRGRDKLLMLNKVESEFEYFWLPI